MKGNCDYMIGQRLMEIRQKLGITQAELARKIDVKPAEISQYERGKRTPRWDKFNQIIDEFNISADYLLGREISAVSENEEYKARVASNDLHILKILKQYPELYNVILKNPERSIKAINNNLKNLYPE